MERLEALKLRVFVKTSSNGLFLTAARAENSNLSAERLRWNKGRFWSVCSWKDKI
jgi:hypothetical protein